MKVEIKNLGPLKDASFEVGGLTIICGENNTGKTTAAHLLFDFLNQLPRICELPVNPRHVEELVAKHHATIDLAEYRNAAIQAVSVAAGKMSKTNKASKWKFNVSCEPQDFDIERYIKIGFRSFTYRYAVEATKDEGGTTLVLNVCNESPKAQKQVFSAEYAKMALSQILHDCFWEETGGLNPFIISAERTGIAVFQPEINIANGRVVASMKSPEKAVANGFWDKFAGHAESITHNLEFINRLSVDANSFSVFFTSAMDQALTGIIGGSYQFSKDGVASFSPQDAKKRIDIEKWSSSVRGLLFLRYYLRKEARKNQLLIIDEPELNLHPKNQRKIARLLALLVNAGLKVMITTHSDYIVKEFNTLLMLGDKENERAQALMAKYGYTQEEVLDIADVRAYSAKDGAFVPANMSQGMGIEIEGFDEAIVEMGNIQRDILFGE